VNNERRTFR